MNNVFIFHLNFIYLIKNKKMKKQIYITLITSKEKFKRLLPKNFNELIIKAQEILPLNDQFKKYQFIEQKSKREIKNQEDYEKMSREYKNEKIIKINFSIVDKNEKYKDNNENIQKDIQKNNQISFVSSINLNNNLLNNNNDDINNENIEEENEDEDNVENEIKSMVKEKMKQLEDNLVEKLYRNLQNEIKKEKTLIIEDNNKELSNNIHKGIVCNMCGIENIKGIRYKCAQCSNFNLCNNCEKEYNHDINHIMIKIRNPIINEGELISSINRNISYKNENMNYELEPKIMKFDKNSKEVIYPINLLNTGMTRWRNVYLKCIEEISEIIGNKCEVSSDIKSGGSYNDQIKFDNLQEKIIPNKKIYYCFYQMFNKENESFGNVTKIKIIIE